MHLYGWLSLPTFTLAQASQQYFYVNGRAVKDKIVTHAIRQAYENSIPAGRHPAFVLFLQIDPSGVDVNVHPTKHEVRFREQRLVHDFILRAIQHGLKQIAEEEIAVTNVDDQGEIKGRLQPEQLNNARNDSTTTPSYNYPRHNFHSQSVSSMQVKEQLAAYTALYAEPITKQSDRISSNLTPDPIIQENKSEFLGQAICLLHGAFILAEKPTGLIIVDVKLARQQIYYNNLAIDWRAGNIASQPLLFPESISLDESQIATLCTEQELLSQLGIGLEAMGRDIVVVRQVPVILKGISLNNFLTALSSTLQNNQSRPREELLNELLLTIATHGAKASSIINEPNELNQFLRELEQVTHQYATPTIKPWRQFSMDELKKLIAS